MPTEQEMIRARRYYANRTGHFPELVSQEELDREARSGPRALAFTIAVMACVSIALATWGFFT